MDSTKQDKNRYAKGIRQFSGKTYQSIFYPESNFGGFTDIDGTIAFYARVNSLMDSKSIILDIGCGRGTYQQDTVAVRRNLRVFRHRCAKVIGIDVDKTANANTAIDEFRLIENDNWPIEDKVIDIAVCDSVLEHIEDVNNFFFESQRVIKPGGYFCIRTSNLLSYVAFFSKLIPQNFHARIISKVQDRREENDVFPKFYRCNTTIKIRKMLTTHGFDHCIYGYEAEPSYLTFSKWAYFLGTVYQKIVPKTFANTIFAFGKKREAGE